MELKDLVNIFRDNPTWKNEINKGLENAKQ